MSEYATKVTWLGDRYGCRIFKGGVLVLEGWCYSRDMIGTTFRDLIRTLDKSGGDSFTSAVRKRRYKEGDPIINVKHLWYGRSTLL